MKYSTIQDFCFLHYVLDVSTPSPTDDKRESSGVIEKCGMRVKLKDIGRSESKEYDSPFEVNAPPCQSGAEERPCLCVGESLCISLTDINIEAEECLQLFCRGIESTLGYKCELNIFCNSQKTHH